MVEVLGKWLNKKLKDLVYASGFFFLVIKETFLFIRRKQVGFKVLVLQILYTGVEALSVIALLSMGIGAIIIIQGLKLLPQFGQGELIYSILITIITRELGPVLTAFIIIARSGTAIATELGGMVVSHEIESYVSIGINPISYLVVPRFLGVTISLLLLNIYFNVFGLAGSYILTQLVKPIPFTEYFSLLLQNLQWIDIASSMSKSFIFGIIISIISTYYGFSVQQASYEVPVAAIKAVGTSFVFCIVADAIITYLFFLQGL